LFQRPAKRPDKRAEATYLAAWYQIEQQGLRRPRNPNAGAGFEAFNTDDRSIGLFGSQREATDALSSGPHRMAETAARGATVTKLAGFSHGHS
jgi:hypothetical protein